MTIKGKFTKLIGEKYVHQIGSGYISAVLIFIIGLSLFTHLGQRTVINPQTNPIEDINSPFKTNFATYNPISLVYTPQINPTKIASDFSNVDLQGFTLTEEEKGLLAQYGFFLRNTDFQTLDELYTSLENKPKFITTDLALHSFHIMFDYSLRYLEVHYFLDDFKTLINELSLDQQQTRNLTTNTDLQEIYRNNIAYLSVIIALIDNSTLNVPSIVLSDVQAELNLINSNSPNYSAIFSYLEDYTQYTPRGHYTRTADLEKYFKAMMYTGRMSFITDLQEPDLAVEQTKMALSLVLSLNRSYENSNLWTLWDKIYGFIADIYAIFGAIDFMIILSGLRAKKTSMIVNKISVNPPTKV